MAAAPAKPLTSAQLRAALITPESVGDSYEPNPKRNREALDAESARTKKCVNAVKALKPLLASKAAVFIDKEGKPSGVKQFSISGTPAKMASWQTVGKVIVRDCNGGRAGANGSKASITKLSITKLSITKLSITKLSIGKLGDWAYGIRYKQTTPEAHLSPIHAADVVLTRVKNTVTLLVSDGFFATFDAGLSKRAAKVAVSKLRNAQ
ncbi:hypothetical protein [Nonomuraea sp. LPB2021202275-12-8]|uniref:hypothetical protein n=1 Tax=Nonomuraea sp. LPB2021202275-12-8 TaxID=3120159 RepID=UPI00300DBD0B